MKEVQFNDLAEWQFKTFPGSDCIAKLNHLLEEINEVAAEVTKEEVDGEALRLEFADCFLLLAGAAASIGMSYQDVCKAIDDKMVINSKRVWGKPNEFGVVNHVKDGTDI